MEPSLNSTDVLYREISIKFQDGRSERFVLEMSIAGTHFMKAPSSYPPWTYLDNHKCPNCPLSSHIRNCPAATSLHGTIAKFQDHASYDVAQVTAIDGIGRRITLEAPMQEVGTIFIHLALFSSDCPIGRSFRKTFKGLRRFATYEEFTRHLIIDAVLVHQGDLVGARASLEARLQDLHTVLTHLCRRIQGEVVGDVVQNAIVQLDIYAQFLELRMEDSFAEMALEYGWKLPQGGARDSEPEGL